MKLFMVLGCDGLRLFICAFRTLTVSKCVSLFIMEKEAKIALLCFRKGILRFFENIGSSTDPSIRMDICFTPEGKNMM